MATRFHGIIDESGEWDEDGYRSYHYTYLIQSNDRFDGPSVVSVTPGLPLPGALYQVGNDNDPWCWCRRNRRFRKHMDRQGDSLWWTAEITFSNRPPEGRGANQRDPSQGVDNPLLEPHKISVRSIKDREAATHDLFGKIITNSAHELLQGPQLEFDIGRASVRVEQNVIDAQSDLCDLLMNTLNSTTMWGLPKRCVKLCNWGMEPKYYNNYLKYYTRWFELETDRRTWDRWVPDVGTKVLNGEYSQSTGLWVTKQINGADPDPLNPAHFIEFRDRFGQPGKVALNGAGLPANTLTALDSYSLSIQAGNTGHLLSEHEWWVPFHGDQGDWSPDVIYQLGDIVTFGGATYVSTSLQTQTNTAFAFQEWLLLPSGVTSAGNYAEATTYALGDKVRDITRTGVGYKHVKKYPENNLFVLNLPTLL